MKKKASIIIAVVAVLVGASVGIAALAMNLKKKEPVVETETASKVLPTETEEKPVVDTHEGQAKSRLTGEWMDATLVDNRPLAVMIENTSAAQPHYNLSRADIIYECPVEGAITRMMAVFQDYQNMERLGNIRSCRYYFLYFSREFDAIYAHCGQNELAIPLLESNEIDNINGVQGIGNVAYYRTNDRKAPHNLYASTEGINAAIDQLGYRRTLSADFPSHFIFAQDEQPTVLVAGADCKAFDLQYRINRPWFEYNDADGLYYRFQFDGPQMDAVTNTQVAVKNVIVQYVNTSVYNDYGVLQMDCLSGGNGKYITGGKVIDITWKKDSDSARTQYFDANGNEIVVNQGKTWVSVIDNSTAENNHFYATKEERN